MHTFDGYMVPGIYFESDMSIWLFRWKTSSLASTPIVQVWLTHPDGKSSCFSDPKEELWKVKTYVRFDEMSGASIDDEKRLHGLCVSVFEKERQILKLILETKRTLINRMANIFLPTLSRKVGEKGKTQSGKGFINRPKTVISITNAEFTYKGEEQGRMIKPKKSIRFGDIRIAPRPIIYYGVVEIEK